MGEIQSTRLLATGSSECFDQNISDTIEYRPLLLRSNVISSRALQQVMC